MGKYNYHTIQRSTSVEDVTMNKKLTEVPFESDDPSKIKEGMEVEHQRFGNGTVSRLEGAGADKLATIKFEGIGDKKILLRFARLKIIK
jgi:DNA helicase-2/ATP-dependent DNA helicase PcrA